MASNKVQIEIPGTFTESEILKISAARNAGIKMSNDADHVADSGAQLYASFENNLGLVERTLGLPLKFRVSKQVFAEICTLAGRVNL
ncbi:hypothetical protein CO168_02395 [Candidatus Shapirobacteria bacterium CG_4_9_14_3_um_filter_36_12]|uniref:Uncharacterized protein n=1 Tax=Candidatus Shapirobacteria bacterium CG_4_9_14_3_um_filter_36_12 TaxID=1974877 RepID=A0A2M7XMZ2_9BACT|nr:MAG: hypothetical protein CO168_02395 [Candidatus Shapirobacteria bacterium CG_4_9_14_3_um_filter_36_12]